MGIRKMYINSNKILKALVKLDEGIYLTARETISE